MCSRLLVWWHYLKQLHKKQVNQIASLDEISETRTILYTFKALTVFEQNVRKEVSKMVDDRERFLKAQQE